MSAKRVKIQLEAQEYEKEGKYHFEEGKFPEAIDFYSKYLALKKTADAYAMRAWAYLKLNLPMKASQDVASAIDVDAKNPKANLVKALSLIAVEKYEESIASLEKCLKLQPDNGEAINQLKMMKQKIGSKHDFGETHLDQSLGKATEVRLFDEKCQVEDEGGEKQETRKTDSVSSDEFVSFEKSADYVMDIRDKKVAVAEEGTIAPCRSKDTDTALVSESDEGNTACVLFSSTLSRFPEKNLVKEFDLLVGEEDNVKEEASFHVSSNSGNTDAEVAPINKSTKGADDAGILLLSPMQGSNEANTMSSVDALPFPEKMFSKEMVADVEPGKLYGVAQVGNKSEAAQTSVKLVGDAESGIKFIESRMAKIKITEDEKPVGQLKSSLSIASQPRKSRFSIASEGSEFRLPFPSRKESGSMLQSRLKRWPVGSVTKARTIEMPVIGVPTICDYSIVQFINFTAITEHGPLFHLVDKAGNTTSLKSWSEVVSVLKECRYPINRVILQEVMLDKQALEFFRSLDPICFDGVEMCFNGIDFSTVRGSFTEIFEKMVKPKMVQFAGIKGVNNVLLCKALNTYPGLRDASIVRFFDFAEFVSPIKVGADALVAWLHNGLAKKKVFSLIRSHLAVGLEDMVGRLIEKFLADSKRCSFSLLVEFPDDKKCLPVERIVENSVTGEKLEVKVSQSNSLDLHMVSPGTLHVVGPGLTVEVVRGSSQE